MKEKKIVLFIPENTVKIEMTARVYNNGEIVDINLNKDLSDIRAGFEAAEAYKEK